MSDNQKPSLQDIRAERRDRQRELLASLYASDGGGREIFHSRGTKKRASFRRSAFFLLGGGVMVGLGLYAVSLFSAVRYFEALGKQWYAHASHGVLAMSSFDIEEAHRSFAAAQEAIERLSRLDDTYRLTGIARMAGAILPESYRGIQNASAVLGALREVNSRTVSILESMQELKTSGMNYLFSGQGDLFLALLGRLKDDVGSMRDSLSGLRADVSRLPSQLEHVAALQEKIRSEFVAADIMLMKSERFVGTLARFFDAVDDPHIVVIFQNPSEIRATGGFVGSYADVVFRSGAIASLEVVDIYDPDGQRAEAIIPPEPLRAITARWGARDANWFFDFPTSMSKFLEMLEASKIYRERNVAFQGVVAINTKVIEDILEVIGPIAMPEYDLDITRDNFLLEIQKEVETGYDKYAHGEPKRILKLLTPRLLKQIAALSAKEKGALMRALTMRAQNKDIQVYMRNPVMQAFIEGVGLSGALLDTGFGFEGDYLGVVNSNIAGGKTDAVVKQKVRLESAIDEAGTVTNRLSVTRRHTGAQQRYAWYRATNQNYLRIYAPPRAELVYAEGFSKKRVYDLVNYGHPQYIDDTLLASIERTAAYFDEYYADAYHEEDKRVFGLWLNVVAGQARTLTMEYELYGRARVGDGARHIFVLEKQSGVDSEYEIVFRAPIGYVWLESGRGEYVYEAPKIFSREIITLTMIKK